MARQYIKTKSFGIIEAMISSSILIVILSAATYLMFNSRKSVELTTARYQAEQIANDIFQRLAADKATGLVTFIDTDSDEDFPIECYDTTQISNPECKTGANYKGKIPFADKTGTDGGYDSELDGQFLPVPKVRTTGNFSDNYFKMKIKVDHNQTLTNCKLVDTIEIQKPKCAMVRVDIEWKEKGRDTCFSNTQYFSDWEN